MSQVQVSLKNVSKRFSILSRYWPLTRVLTMIEFLLPHKLVPAAKAAGAAGIAGSAGAFAGAIGQVSNQVNMVIMGLAGAHRIFALLDEDSDLMELHPGDNVLTADAASGTDSGSTD